MALIDTMQALLGFGDDYADLVDTILYRRTLTEVGMLGVGHQAKVLCETADNIRSAMDERSVLQMRFDLPHNRRYSPKLLHDPGPYTDLKLERGKDQRALDCDLTFWTVECLHLIANVAI